MIKKYKTSLMRAEWLIPVIIFTCAFAIRLAFTMQVKDSLYWRVPLVDALSYNESAKLILDDGWLAPYRTSEMPYSPYYQPPFYQAFLALIYLIFGRSVFTAIIIQYLLGSLCCVLTYFLGRRFFDRRTGVAAGIAMAFTSSQIFYEGRLLPPVLIIFFNLTIILLASKQLKSPVTWRWPVIGLLLGLSAITRPDILLFAPALLFWMWMERKTVLTIRPLLAAAMVLAPIVLIIGLVAARNYYVGGDSVIISYNGGINLYIGNNPNMEMTLGIRPGIRWEAIESEPMLRHGIQSMSKWDRWLYQFTFKTMWKCKRATLSNFVRKSIWVWHGPEIRRNEDDYYLTRVSSIYRMLLWRKGNFGFPFGVIAPFALLGIMLSMKRRRELFLLYAFVITQVMMLVLFFPCSRYRVPLTPVLLLFGAAAAFELVDLIRRKRFGDTLPLLFTLGAFGIMSTLCPPRFEGSPKQIEAENYRLLANSYYMDGQTDVSIEMAKKGVEIMPKDPDLHKWLFEAYITKQDYANAEKEGLAVIRLVPSYLPIYRKMVDIYEAEGKYAEARKLKQYIGMTAPIKPK